MTFALRPYQLSAVEGVRKHYRAGKRATIIISPTGSGKTVIAAHIIEAAISRDATQTILFLAHRKELIDQCFNKLRDIGILAGVIKSDDFRTDYSKTVQIASVQTLTNRLEGKHNLAALPVKLIAVDECHHATAASYKRILAAYPEAKVIGLTATPYRADGAGLGELFDSYVEVATLEELIEMSFLVPPLLYTGTVAELGNVKITAGDYNEKELAEKMDTTILVGDIVQTWFKRAEGRKTLFFGVNCAHARHVCQLFKDAGVAADYVDGETPEAARVKTFANFQHGATTILCNVGIATEGYDCPACSCVILARPTKSRCLWRQMVGRGMRPLDGKVDFMILDHAGCDAEHGWVLTPDKVSLATKKRAFKVRESDEEPVCRCRNPECGAVFPKTSAKEDPISGELTCPKCGAPIKSPANKVEADERIELQLVDIAARRRETYRRIAAEGYKKGWKPVAVNMKFKDKFGGFPKEPDREGCAVQVRWFKSGWSADGGWKYTDAGGLELPPVKRHFLHERNLERMVRERAAPVERAAPKDSAP